MDPVISLLPELNKSIFTSLSFKDLSSSSQVSNAWRQFVERGDLWRDMASNLRFSYSAVEKTVRNYKSSGSGANVDFEDELITELKAEHDIPLKNVSKLKERLIEGILRTRISKENFFLSNNKFFNTEYYLDSENNFKVYDDQIGKEKDWRAFEKATASLMRIDLK